MADKTTDPYYQRLEAFIDKVLKAAEMMPIDIIMAGMQEHPERFGSLLSALYRARAMSQPTSGAVDRFEQMSDSQLQDEFWKIINSNIGISGAYMENEIKAEREALEQFLAMAEADGSTVQ